MENNYEIENIIESIVNNCKDAGAISISETVTLGTYLCQATEKFYLLLNNKNITISETTNFNGTFAISNLDNENYTFEIQTTSGFDNEIGSYLADFPYYTFEKWTGLTNILQDLTGTIPTQKERFPRLFLNEDISEDWIDEDKFNADIQLFFIINSQEKKRAAWRLENTMAYLIKFLNIFLENLKNSEYVRSNKFIEFRKTKRFYDFTQSTKQNKINSLVDVIELNVTGLKLFYKRQCNY